MSKRTWLYLISLSILGITILLYLLGKEQYFCAWITYQKDFGIGIDDGENVTFVLGDPGFFTWLENFAEQPYQTMPAGAGLYRDTQWDLAAFEKVHLLGGKASLIAVPIWAIISLFGLLLVVVTTLTQLRRESNE